MGGLGRVHWPGFSVRVGKVQDSVVVTRVPPDLVHRLTNPTEYASWDGKSFLSVQDDAPRRLKDQCSLECGGFPSEQRVYAFRDCAVNATCALLERVFYHEIAGVFTVPAQPTCATVEAALSKFKKLLFRKLHRATPVERHLYVEQTYRGRRLKVYQQALEKLDRRGLRHSDSYISAFLKREKILKVPKRTVPRLIQPRSAVFNVELGRYLHPQEHAIYQSIDAVYGAPTVMKGLNALQQGECFHTAWTKFSRPCALMIDASRFDQHIRTGLLKWEHSVYEHIFPGDSYLKQLLKWQLVTKGFLRTEDKCFQYTVQGGRCSGDMNTAVGNILIACASVHAFLDHVGLLGKTRVLDAGDDCVIIGEAGDIERAAGLLQPWFVQLGLIMKVEPLAYTLEGISFCQTNPVFDGSVYKMVRDPRVTLTKDQVLLDHHSLRFLRSQYSSIGDCGISLTGGMPILQEYYMSMGAGTPVQRGYTNQRLIDSGFYQLARGMHEEYRPVTDAARVSFANAFGICPSLQIALERHYRSLSLPTDLTVTSGEVDRIAVGMGLC